MKKNFLMALLSFVSITIQAQFSGPGSGTASSPYLISNADLLNEVRNDLSAHYKLIADIELSDWIDSNMGKNGWIPIGNSSMPFCGVFNGNGHSISGITLHRKNDVGLFGYCKDAVFNDLYIIDADIIGVDNVGCLVGYSINSELQNISVNGKVKGINNVGGAIGYYLLEYPGKHITESKILSKIHSTVNITAENNIGGLIGSIFVNSYCNKPEEGGMEYSSGGGTNNYRHTYTKNNYLTLELNKSYSACEISGGNNIGGIVGSIFNKSKSLRGTTMTLYNYTYANSKANTNIIDCYSLSQIAAADSSICVGGIVGIVSGEESGSSSASGNYVSMLSKLTMDKVSNISSLNGYKYIGGIIGDLSIPRASIIHTCNMGDIDGDHIIGGLIGNAMSDGSVSESYNNGAVTGITYLGGIIGIAASTEIKNSYSNGNIKGTGDYVGGILGKGDCDIENSICCCDVLSGKRFLGRIVGSNSQKGNNNYGLASTRLYSNGYEIDYDDNDDNGFSIGISSLRNKGFYTGLSWDVEHWNISNNLPYLSFQTPFPTLTTLLVENEFYAGGTSDSDGYIYYWVNGERFISAVQGNVWEVSDIYNVNSFSLLAYDGNNQPSSLVRASISIPIYSFSIVPNEVTCAIGDITQFTYNYTPSNALFDIIWSSSNNEIVSVDANGKAVAHSEGECDIIATVSGTSFSSSCHMKVIVPVEELLLNYQSLNLEPNETFQLTAEIKPVYASNKKINWQSMNDKIATVTNDGFVTAVSMGVTTIVAMSEEGNKSTYCVVEVVKHPTEIFLNASELFLATKESFQLEATVLPNDATNKGVIWQSSDNNVCTVSSTGYVKALSEGTSIITAFTEDANKVALCSVHVNKATSIDDIIEESTLVQLNYPTLKVSNCHNDAVLYDVNGQKITFVYKNDKDVIFYLPHTGMYILKYGVKSIKIIATK